jgi:hypothetical protein
MSDAMLDDETTAPRCEATAPACDWASAMHGPELAMAATASAHTNDRSLFGMIGD